MTPHPPDWELIRQYADDGAQPAFAQIVHRYIDFVYSTALRRTGRDTHLAEDITQAVFMILAKRARTIRPGVVLSGWLHHTARYVAANALKREARHRRRRQALRDSRPSQEDPRMPQHTPEDDLSAEWEAIAPLLDTALDRLARADRNAVLLRFMQGKSHREVGDAMGLSEEAARKRIERAIVRLREFFLARGVSVPAAAVGTVLATRAVEAAPALLASATLASTGGAASVPLAKGALAMMAWAKAKLVVGAVAAALLVSTAILITVKQVSARSAGAVRPIAQAAPGPVPAQPAVAQPPQPKAMIEGTVYGIDGEPLPGAEVFLATASRGINVLNPDRRRNPPQITQNDGQFSFPIPAESPAVVAVFHPDGYVQVETAALSKTRHVFLRPWSRIEGVLLDGDRPLPFEEVFIGELGVREDPIEQIVAHQTTVKTDKDGKFALERAAPIGMHLSRQRVFHHTFLSKWDFVELEPGRTANVQLGGAGRHVVGRLLPPPQPVPGLSGPWSWGDRRGNISSEIIASFADVEGMAMPPGFDKLTREQRRKFAREWQKSPETRAYLKLTHVEAYPIEPDGTFRFEDLRPGKYSLYAVVSRQDPGARHREDLAIAKLEFEVPPLTAGQQRVQEPLDLGEIKMAPRPRPNALLERR